MIKWMKKFWNQEQLVDQGFEKIDMLFYRVFLPVGIVLAIVLVVRQIVFWLWKV